MDIVKLNAINSTNQYLKDFVKNKNVKSWTIVSAQYQTSGRGQMHTVWESEKDKNLLFSVLIRFKKLKIEQQFFLNCAFSLGIYKTLLNYKIKDLSIKWPNDIMAGNKKIAGILIENTLVKDRIKYAVIGVGLNVNQTKFSSNLNRATSLKQLLNKDIDRDYLLKEIVDNIKFYIKYLEIEDFSFFKKKYEKILYKIEKFYTYKDIDNQLFTGKIIGINNQGKLLVEQENKMIKEYNFKEIKFL